MNCDSNYRGVCASCSNEGGDNRVGFVEFEPFGEDLLGAGDGIAVMGEQGGRRCFYGQKVESVGLGIYLAF